MVHIPYPSTEQLRHVVQTVQFRYPSGNYPAIQFTGTIKLQGKNCCITRTPSGHILPASRSKYLEAGDKHYGFQAHLEENYSYYQAIFYGLFNDKSILDTHTVRLYGEWAGKGIQKKAGICKVPKSFYIFSVTIEDEDGNVTDCATYDIGILHANIYDIYRFKTYGVTIDFNDVAASIDDIKSIVTSVEKRCPIASYFLPEDLNLIGEGIVWKAYHDGVHYLFKTKGEAHKALSGKTPLTPEQLAAQSAAKTLADSFDNTERYEQALETLYGADYPSQAQTSDIGMYLKLVSTDIAKEEYDILPTDNTERKQVMHYAQQNAKDFFFGILKQQETL